MKQFYTILSLIFLVPLSGAAQNFNLTLKSSVYYSGQTCAGVWGYVDSLGNEYALVGAAQGMAIVNVTDPANPFKVKQVAGPNNKWKEIRTWGKYAFVTNEANSGLQIINLSNLPGTTTPSKYWAPTIGGQQLSTIHALEISNGFLYLHGTNIGNRGTLIVNISDPWNPTYVGKYDSKYVHDGYVRNDTLYAAHISDGYFAVVDVSNKTSPVQLGIQTTPHNYTHNTWLSDDSKTLFTTDEKDGSYLTAYDITNLGNITELDRIKSFPGPNAILHNVYIKNDWAVTTCNTDGINIFDAHRPGNLVLTGSYDTYTAGSGGGFFGVWGGYPYLPSGNILAASRDGYLHILAPSYVRACYVEGIVTDSLTSLPINTATVKILSTTVTDATKSTGDYAIGHPTPGTYNIEFSKTGYFTKTISTVLSAGVVTALNVKLVPLNTSLNENSSTNIQISTYPNPFINSLTVNYLPEEALVPNAQIILTDLTGRTVAVYPAKTSHEEIILHNDIEAGSYFLRIDNGKELTQPVKVVKACCAF